jgi:RimJ/RimL family protein N-acetyltransferase/ubiquinone/menaquinone biosynthesis C-methylase UbiE
MSKFQFLNLQPLDLLSLTIEGDRLRLVAISSEFERDIFNEFTSAIAHYMFPSPAVSIEETRAFITKSRLGMKNENYLNFIILIQGTGEFLGCCSLHGEDNVRLPELGIWIKQSAHGHGYGREAIHLLVTWACHNIDFDYFLYPVDRRNIASRKIPESLGGKIVRESKVETPSGKILDSVIYRIDRSSDIRGSGEPNKDPWLQQWLPLIRSRASNLPILELGCGSGADTVILVNDGHDAIAIDRSAPAIAAAKIKAPAAAYYCQDMRTAFPPNAVELGVVVASLSLHYFDWHETLAIVEQIRNSLKIGGVLLCRVNSTNDHNYGASGHPKIAENYYSVDSETKRFFDLPSIETLFASGWRTIAIEEKIIHKYKHPKCVWEVILERTASLNI